MPRQASDAKGIVKKVFEALGRDAPKSRRAGSPDASRRARLSFPPSPYPPERRGRSAMTERLIINRLAHRGDGVADTPAGPLFVPLYAAGRGPSRSPRSRPPRSPPSAAGRNRETGAHRTVLPPHFGICGGLRHPALDPRPLSWDWKRGLARRRARAGRARRAVDELIEAHGDGRRRATSMPGAGRTASSKWLRRAPRASHRGDRPLPGAGAVARRRHSRRMGRRRSAGAAEKATRHPGHRNRCRHRHGRPRLGPAEFGANGRHGAFGDEPQAGGLTRHGELIAHAPNRRGDRSCTCGFAAGSFLQATAAGEQALAGLGTAMSATPRSFADLFCGLGPFALASLSGGPRSAPSTPRQRHRRAQAGGEYDLGPQADRRPRRGFVSAGRWSHRSSSGFSAVLFDPPSQGAEAQARELAKSAVPLSSRCRASRVRLRATAAAGRRRL